MDTIFALATAQGKAGVAIVRVSGGDAWSACRSLMSQDIVVSKPIVRNIYDHTGEFLDQAMVLAFQGPHSFTGEDTVELHLHGSISVVRAVLDTLGHCAGLRLAEPGEFTRRALENGKLDVARVEGLADLIDAETEAQRKQALRVLSGSLGARADAWRTKLIRAAALLEATIDFADEDVPVDVSPEVRDLLSGVIFDLTDEASRTHIAERIRSGFEVAIVGAPNVGKSTLLNYLLGQKISITSRKPQTTRHQVLGIVTEGNYQTVFVDTPGIHEGQGKAINRYMNRVASSALADVDLVLFVIDRDRWTAEDDLVAQALRQVQAPVALVINKIDRMDDVGELLPWTASVQDSHDFDAVHPVSALRQSNLSNLATYIRQQLLEGQHLFPPDQVTDRSERFLAAELIREKIVRQLGDELPYTTAVEIEGFKQEGRILHINALIYVERSGQKKILIGEAGKRLRTIGTEARKDMESAFDTKVMLKLWVKVKSGWSDDERALRSLGFDDSR